MPTATTQSKDTRSSLNNNSGLNNRKPAKHHSHRYGRVRREGDEEIVREAQSDYGASESEETDEEDSFSESSIVSMPESRLQSGSRGQPTPEQSNVHVSVVSETSEPGPSSGTRLLNALREPRLDWSDAAFAEGDVPVVQFDEMGDIEAIDDKKNGDVVEKHMSKAHHTGPPSFKRPVGMTARQVYLKRLENDPAYTPRVGEFWGHDERLLDKDLRSLSGWWRVKWTGRGGPAPSFHDRGRHESSHPARGTGHSSRGRGSEVVSQSTVDPVDQAWKHDGFEEMKKADEGQHNSVPEESQRTGNWVNARGRGRGGFARGTGAPGRMNRSQSFASQSQPLSPASIRPQGHTRGQSVGWNRYEHAWTKHAVTFLFQDTLNKPREGGNIGVRVKLPGQHRFNVVRVPGKSTPDGASEPAGSIATPSRAYIVKLPKVSKKEEESRLENAHTAPLPPIPDQIATNAPTVSVPTISKDLPPNPPTPPPSNDASLEVTSIPPEQVQLPQDPPSAPLAPSEAQETSSVPVPVEAQPKVLPTIHLITSFPPNAPSPAFPSPSYGPGPQYSLHRPAAVYPPGSMPGAESGVWYDPRMPYGYPTPPPLPNQMYTPPPQIHHGHHHSHSMSHPNMIPQPNGVAPPYFVPPMQQGPPMGEYGHPIPSQPDMRSPSFTYGADGAMIDLHTGTPIFSLPKGAKVAIKKPTEGDQVSSQHQRNKSMSSSAGAPPFVPLRKEGIEAQPVYSRPPPEMQTPTQGYMHGPPQGQGFWAGYQQPPPQGYYYPHQAYGVPPPHAQDYGYGQPMHGPGVPVQGYAQSPYEGGEYQPPVYY